MKLLLARRKLICPARVILSGIVSLLLLSACGGAPVSTLPEQGEPSAPTETGSVASPTAVSSPTATEPGPTPSATAVAEEEAEPGYTLVPVTEQELSRPTTITHAGDERLFVVKRGGTIWVVMPDGTVPETPFLDLDEEVARVHIEQGLLGMVFHPNYAENGFFYINYTNLDEDTILSRWEVSEDDPNLADPDSETVILKVEQPSEIHNGGNLVFGPDGYLYVGMGDGGLGGDPHQEGQNLGSLFGTILRIDVDGGDPYAIPPDNPFVDVEGARPEIWVYGLRNPWRFSFDRETGDLYIGDVGESAYEEINFQPADSPGGENYGWSIMEGSACFNPPTGCDPSQFVGPIYEYPREQSVAVIGGFVYRGEEFPSLRGGLLHRGLGRAALAAGKGRRDVAHRGHIPAR